MYFLNYKETDLNYINNSSLRSILLKQNVQIRSSYILKLPNIKYYFIFKKIVDINLLKIYNNIVLIWLLTGKILVVKNFFVKLERGVKYYRFFLTSKKLNNISLLFNMFDFLSNTLFYLIDKRFLKTSFDSNIYFLKLLNLEFFSNVRLANNFYTSKLNDILYMYIFIKNFNFFSLKKLVRQFKINFKDE
jgi:hypothetical protein